MFITADETCLQAQDIPKDYAMISGPCSVGTKEIRQSCLQHFIHKLKHCSYTNKKKKTSVALSLRVNHTD
jgi:hypothetical protein